MKLKITKLSIKRKFFKELKGMGENNWMTYHLFDWKRIAILLEGIARIYYSFCKKKINSLFEIESKLKLLKENKEFHLKK